MAQRAYAATDGEHLYREVGGDHPNAMEGTLERAAGEWHACLVGRLLEQVHERHVVGEDDDLPMFRFLGEPLGKIRAALMARRVKTSAGNVWVIPGNGFICLDVGGISCNATEQAASRGMVMWTSARSGDQSIVHGLVPDAVEEVTLIAEDGTANTVPVCDNVYGALLAGGFKSVRFTGSSGTVVVGPFSA